MKKCMAKIAVAVTMVVAGFAQSVLADSSTLTVRKRDSTDREAKKASERRGSLPARLVVQVSR